MVKKIPCKYSLLILMTTFLFGCGNSNNIVKDSYDNPESITYKLKKQGALIKTFEGPSGLTGAVIRDRNGEKSIGWLTKDEMIFFAGKLINSKGEDISLDAERIELGLNKEKKPAQLSNKVKDSNPQHSKPALQEKVSFNSEGNNEELILKSLPGINLYKGDIFIYVMADPNCPFCNKFYKLLKKYESVFSKTDLNIKWMPIAVLSKSSEGKAVAILKKGKKGLHENEINFTKGGIKEAVDEKLLIEIKKTSEYGETLLPNFGAPSLIWFKDNKPMGRVGVPSEKEFRELLKYIGKINK